MKWIKKVSFYLLLLIAMISFIGCKPLWSVQDSQKLDRSVITNSR